MKRLLLHLDVVSAQAFRPPASLEELQAAEKTLHVELPWELWEVYRFRNGQEAEAGVQFANGARLLTLQEMVPSALDTHLQRSVSSLAVEPDRRGDQVSQEGHGGSHVLLPLSNVLRGNRRYVVDVAGCVWLQSSTGFTMTRQANSLAEFLRRILT